MQCKGRLTYRLWLLLCVLMAAFLFSPAASVAQPPAGNGQLVIVSDEGQVAALGLFPDQVVRADVALLQAADSDPNPNWRNRDFDDSGWGVVFPVQRVAPWATVTLADADHVWGGPTGGPLTADVGNGTAYPRRFDGSDYDNGYPIAASPLPQYLFLRKNFCIPINTQLSDGAPLVTPNALSMLAAIDGNLALWLNGLYSLWSGAGGNALRPIPMPPSIPAVFERGNNTLSMRAGENNPANQAALLYRWEIGYTIDPAAIQISASANPASVGQSVDFAYTDDGLSNRPPFAPTWDFGDASGDSDSPHTFTAPGTFTVTLRLLDADGCPGVAQMVIEVAAPSLQITKTAPASAYVGDVIQFDLSVTNPGSTTLTGVIVTDTLPAGTSFFACSDSCVLAGNDVVWNLGTLAPGAVRTVWLRVQITPSAGATITNTYRASSAETGVVQGVPVVVQIIQPPTSTATPTATPRTPTPTNTTAPPTPTSTTEPPTPTATSEPPTPTATAQPSAPTATSRPPRPPSPEPPTPPPTPYIPELLPVTGGKATTWTWILIVGITALWAAGMFVYYHKR